MDSNNSDANLHSHDTNSSSEDEANSDDDIDDLFEVLRMDKCTFLKLLDRVKDHSIFQNESSHPQALVVVQLAVALDRLGHEGNGVCNERSKELWGVSHGTIVNYTKRVLVAIEDRLAGELK
ncbi:hypothetical protein R1flu_029151 [Riccia fluitans]|uniref:Uncharacterized protein n=1 Tax=Riccia fluitans TaxID=41844 RepID=A0ABD1XPD2_9MARC